jgi:hypothetical protein
VQASGSQEAPLGVSWAGRMVGARVYPVASHRADPDAADRTGTEVLQELDPVMV